MVESRRGWRPTLARGLHQACNLLRLQVFARADIIVCPARGGLSSFRDMSELDKVSQSRIPPGVAEKTVEFLGLEDRQFGSAADPHQPWPDV
jgi:hypothetical protein